MPTRCQLWRGGSTTVAGFHPPPLQVAEPVRSDHHTHRILHQHDRPKNEQGADEDGGGRAIQVFRKDDDGNDQPGNPEEGQRVFGDTLDVVDEIVTTA